MRFALRAAASIALFLACQQPSAADDAWFQLEARIDMPDVAGRIDHLAYDVVGRRLFVAELGNDSIDVVDVTGRRVIHRMDIGSGGDHDFYGSVRPITIAICSARIAACVDNWLRPLSAQ